MIIYTNSYLLSPEKLIPLTLFPLIRDEPEILEAFPDLEREDITESLRYAAEAVRERELPLVKVV